MPKKEDYEKATKKVEEMIKQKNGNPVPPGGGGGMPDRCCPREYIR